MRQHRCDALRTVVVISPYGAGFNSVDTDFVRAGSAHPP